ncbi:hypothetical protein [Marinifilum flexuosum]|uniref:hypothetical protein n=1 Tax=Marinifilum flexuosum TaxID=1117708 RepID=UPI0024954513|nr:hypothetical protein [Marinifilum flexuosum]
MDYRLDEQTANYFLELASDKRTTTLYGVFDPITDKFMYVGNTSLKVNDRRQKACTHARKQTRTDRYHKWLKSTIDKGDKVVYKSLYHGEIWYAKDLEFIIREEFKDTLLNTLPGGGHITTYHHTEEMKQHLSKALKAYHKNKKSSCKEK